MDNVKNIKKKKFTPMGVEAPHQWRYGTAVKLEPLPFLSVSGHVHVGVDRKGTLSSHLLYTSTVYILAQIATVAFVKIKGKGHSDDFRKNKWTGFPASV